MTNDWRNSNAQIVSSLPIAAACALVIVGAWLRLHNLDAMEFKRDEQDALTRGIQLLADRPWWSGRGWPTHGMMSSNGVPNAPLFTWIVAAMWALAADPVGVAAVIAIVNAASLYPLWRWARRRMDDERALVTLAICAVSPFAVMFSRKIWTQDLLLPGVVALLWGIEWLREWRAWRGVALLLVAGLLVGQLHQSGAIAIALVPPAIALQWFCEPHRVRFRLGRPTIAETVAILAAVIVNVFFWAPYVSYLVRLPPGLLANRPTLPSFTPDLLMRVGGQIIPFDLFDSFDPARDDFFSGSIRPFCYYAAVVLGAPLFVYGLWRWIRAPLSIPVFGIWWWCVIAVFTLARIPSHPFYALALTPLPAALAAGAFDPQTLHAATRRALWIWRVVYVVALFCLTLATDVWVAARGGAAGDYGVAYNRRKAQAEAIVARTQPAPATHVPASSELSPQDGTDGLTCRAVPAEVTWMAIRLDPDAGGGIDADQLCDGWIDTGRGLTYRWALRGSMSAR